MFEEEAEIEQTCSMRTRGGSVSQPWQWDDDSDLQWDDDSTVDTD